MAYSLSWIKLWIEILDDPKMGQLSDHLYRRAIELFLLAGRAGLDGILPDVRSMAWTFRATEESVLADLQALARDNIVMQQKSGEWIVTNFSKRQSAISTAQRVAEHRARKKDVTKCNETCNDDVTNDSVSVSDSVSPLILSESKSVSESGEVGAFGVWLDKFQQLTGIAETTYDTRKASDAIKKMIAAGATTEHFEAAYMAVKDNYTIISPASLLTPTVNAMRKANSPPTKAAPQRKDIIDYAN